MKKSRSEFPNSEIYAAQQEIRQRYNDVLSKLIRTISGVEVRDMLSKFRDVLGRPKDDPIGKLPVYNVTYGLSPVKNKHGCLLNFISNMVQRNWEFNKSEEMKIAERVQRDLTFLESVAEKRLDKFETKGEKFPGYYLREKT